MTWLDDPAIIWDLQTIGDPIQGACYWEIQSSNWYSKTLMLDEKNHPANNTNDAPSNPKTNTLDSSSTNSTGRTSFAYITYQALFSTAALIVAKLRDQLNSTIRKSSASSSSDIPLGIPVVVAIPEGPWLPLAMLVVHALNRPFAVDDNQMVYGILVPLEPGEALERNRRILQDIQPQLILAVSDADIERIQGLLQVSQQQQQQQEENACQVLHFATFVNTAEALFTSYDPLQEFWTTNDWDDNIKLQDMIAAGADFISDMEQISTPSRSKHSSMLHERISHIVFTSGTTGRPKGCVSSIQSLQHYMQVKNKVYSITSHSTVLLASALSFDPNLSDILATLNIRGRLAIAPRSQLLGNLSYLLRTLQVSHILCTPTLWEMVNASRNDFTHLQVIALGGEPIPKSLTQKWARPKTLLVQDNSNNLGNCRLFATYGVTEACVYQTAGEICLGEATANGIGQYVGTPFSGLTVRICNEIVQDTLVDVAAGDVGEVILLGAQVDVLTGYWKRPDLGSKFVREVQGDGTTRYHYRTGDRGIVNPLDGTLRILGRIVGEDAMVKVNGVRIELGEIEAALVDDVGALDSCLSTPGIVVESCMVRVVHVEDEHFSSTTRSDVQAFCVLSDVALQELGLPKRTDLPKSGVLVTDGVLLVLLQARCRASIKAACKPNIFVILPRLPLSPTGKRDRSALPNIGECTIIGEKKEDVVLLEDYGLVGRFLAKTIIDCLNLQPIQRDMLTTTVTLDMLGGDSLAATRIVRALYAYHHQVDNTRYLGGDYGQFEGPFDVIHLLRAKSLGEYVDMLDQNGIGAKQVSDVSVQKEEHDDISEPTLEASDEKADAENGIEKRLYDSLFESATLGRSAISLALLHAGANPNFGSHGKRLGKVSGGFFYRKLAFNSSPLHLACVKGDDRLVQHLLYKGAKVKSPDASGLFPIHLAASSLDGTESNPEEDQRRLNIVKYLLEAGSPLVMRDGNHQTVLHAAARAGHVSILRYYMLLWKEEGGEAPDLKVAKRFVNWLDRWFRTPVHWAILNGRVEALQILLELGCTATPYKPKMGKRTSVAMEYPMELCNRLYPPDNDDDKDERDRHKHAQGETMRKLLTEAIAKENSK